MPGQRRAHPAAGVGRHHLGALGGCGRRRWSGSRDPPARPGARPSRCWPRAGPRTARRAAAGSTGRRAARPGASRRRSPRPRRARTGPRPAGPGRRWWPSRTRRWGTSRSGRTPGAGAGAGGRRGSEDAPQGVQLVDHDVAEPHEEGGPAGVVGEQAHVEHVGVGQQHRGVAPGPGPGVGVAVAVVAGGHDAGEVEVGQRAELVLGQRLGREEEQRGAGAGPPRPPRPPAPGSRATSPRPCRWPRPPTARPGRGRWPWPGGPTDGRRAGGPDGRRQGRPGRACGPPGREALEVDQAAVVEPGEHLLQVHPVTVARRTHVPGDWRTIGRPGPGEPWRSVGQESLP